MTEPSSPPINYPPPDPPHYHEVEQIDGTYKSGPSEHFSNRTSHSHRIGYMFKDDKRILRFLEPAEYRPDHRHTEGRTP